MQSGNSKNGTIVKPQLVSIRLLLRRDVARPECNAPYRER
jgi:hypothetical protein